MRYQSYSVSENGANYEVKAYFRVGGKTGTTLRAGGTEQGRV